MAMWSISDYERIKNKVLKEHYKIYLKSLDNLAIFYVISKEASENYIKLETNGKKFLLSNDFHESATTIITDKEAVKLIHNNTYLNYLKEDFIIRICTILEDFINKLLGCLKVDDKEALKFNAYDKIYSLNYKSDSAIFRRIYYIINKFSLDMPIYTKSTQTLEMLDQVIVLRNVLIHYNGKITKETHDTIIKSTYKDTNNNIIIPNNTIDDFIHRFTLNIKPLVTTVDEYLEK